MVSGLREWASATGLLETSPFTQLEHRRIAIAAENYINGLLTGPQTREPLLPALGGLPFTLDKLLRDQLQVFKECNITPIFIFDGLRNNAQQTQLRSAAAYAKTVGGAWDLYNASDPERAVSEFGTCTLFGANHIYRHVQSFFHENNVHFLVAPYSACAQLASMDNTKWADAVAGTTELLMFEVERVILDLDTTTKQFTWIARNRCIQELGLNSSAQFIDACLFAGSSFLPTLPPVRDETMHNPKSFRIRAASDMLLRSGVTGNDLVLRYRDAPGIQALDYIDQYRRALMSLKHHVVIAENGRIEPFNKDGCPSDVHLFIGQHVPDELLYYLSRGVVGPRVLSWRTSGELIESPPLDGGLSATYQKLVMDQLTADRTTSLALLSYCLHRFYQHHSVTQRCWFDMNDARELSIRDVSDPKVSVRGWQTRLDAITARSKAIKSPRSTLTFAIQSLQDAGFAKSTMSTLSNTEPVIFKDVDEVRCNVLWRYLQLKGYITTEHTLSARGLALAAAFDSIDSSSADAAEVAEAVLIATELLTHKLLTSDVLFAAPPYHGAPFRGPPVDQGHTLLVSRVACLGRIKHKAMGYTGPLSRNLLAYLSIVTAVRSTQRDMLEMSFCSMLLCGSVDRSLGGEKLRTISFGLPFTNDNDCGLAIAVKHYLDELSGHEGAITDEVKNGVKSKGGQSWLPHAVDFEESLRHAFAIWDAVIAAVRVLPADVVSAATKTQWEETNEWLSRRR